MATGQKGTNFKYGIEIGDKSVYPAVAAVKALQVIYVALTPSAVAANTTAEQTFTVNGIGVNDIILDVIKPTAQSGLGIVLYRVAGTNSVAITFSNNTGSSITPTAAETYKIPVLCLT